MSWILPNEYEHWEQYLRDRDIDRDEARKILLDSGFVGKVIFTDCAIPLQIDAILPSGEMCYGPNARVGGDVTMWVFEKECDLSKGSPILFEGERISDAKKYKILAAEMVVLIEEYLQRKNASSAHE